MAGFCSHTVPITPTRALRMAAFGWNWTGCLNICTNTSSNFFKRCNRLACIRTERVSESEQIIFIRSLCHLCRLGKKCWIRMLLSSSTLVLNFFGSKLLSIQVYERPLRHSMVSLSVEFRFHWSGLQAFACFVQLLEFSNKFRSRILWLFLLV